MGASAAALVLLVGEGARDARAPRRERSPARCCSGATFVTAACTPHLDHRRALPPRADWRGHASIHALSRLGARSPLRPRTRVAPHLALHVSQERRRRRHARDRRADRDARGGVDLRGLVVADRRAVARRRAGRRDDGGAVAAAAVRAAASADARGAWRAPRRPRKKSWRHDAAGLRMARRDGRATCASGARGSGAHAACVAFGYTARSVWRGRDRSDRGPRTRASRPSRSLDGGVEPPRNADRGLLARASVAEAMDAGQRRRDGTDGPGGAAADRDGGRRA